MSRGGDHGRESRADDSRARCARDCRLDQNIGFTVIVTYGDDGEGLSFAMLSFGSGEVMFSSGGQHSTRDRREVDLYVYSDNVDDLHGRLKDRGRSLKALMTPFTECASSSSATSTGFG